MGELTDDDRLLFAKNAEIDQLVAQVAVLQATLERSNANGYREIKRLEKVLKDVRLENKRLRNVLKMIQVLASEGETAT